MNKEKSFINQVTLTPDIRRVSNFENKMKDKIERIVSDAIPLCSECLYEIKDGNYICIVCQINMCEHHLILHEKKSNSSEVLHKIYKLELKV